MFSKVIVVLIDDDVDGNLDFSREFCTFALCDANKTIGDEGITVDFWIIKVHTSN